MKLMPTTSARPPKSPRPADGGKPAAEARAGTRSKAAPQRQSSPQQKTAAPGKTTLADLKRNVLALAKVTSTKNLKRQNVDLRHLDFRLKASWSQALAVLQRAHAAYPDWNQNPPEEYRELFGAIDAASEAYARSIDKGLRLSEELDRAADDMETLSSELQEEAEELKTIHSAAARQAKARRQN